MPVEKCTKIIRLLKQARSIAADVPFSPTSPATVPKVFLLALLYRIQAMVVSLRADLIDEFCSTEPIEDTVAPLAGSPEEDPSQPGRRQPKAGCRCQVIAFDRRRVRQDRRRIPTYIARDRRSGVVDRRKGSRSQ